MIVAIACFVIPALFGIVSLLRGNIGQEKTTVALMGTVLGLAIFISFTYLLNALITIGLVLVLFVLTTLLAITIYLFLSPATRHNWQRLHFDRSTLIVLICLTIICTPLALRLFFVKDGGLYTGILNAYGDLGWHVSNVTAFAQNNVWTPQNPIYSGTPLIYPFFVNYFSALLITGGFSLVASIVWPAIILMPLLFTLFYCLCRRVVPEFKSAAAIALILFIGSGGVLGWTRIAPDLQQYHGSITALIKHLPSHDYTGSGGDPNGYNFLNPILSLLLPERSFLFGMPLAFTVLLLLLDSRKKHSNWRALIAAGVGMGLLPLFHAHTVLALLPIIAGFFWFDTHKLRWLYFVIPGAILGLPEVFYLLFSPHTAGSFFRFGPGWVATGANSNFFWFWFKNTGLLLPLSLLSMFLPIPRPAKLLAAGGIVMFVISNLWLFAPWPWDNFKLLIYWLIFSLPAIGWQAAYVLQRTPSAIVHVGLVIVIVFHVLTASVDLLKTVSPTAPSWTDWDAANVAAGQMIQKNTKPGDSVLAFPSHNSPVALSGRLNYLGFPGHVWSHGGSPQDREPSIIAYYQNQVQFLPEPHPHYVLVGPLERNRYAGLTIRPNWQKVGESIGGYELYMLR